MWLEPVIIFLFILNCKYYNLHVHMDKFKMILAEENLYIFGRPLTANVFQYYDKIINI